MSPVSRTAAVLAGGLVSTALIVPAAVSPAHAAAACAPAKNIEAIIDDSGSMFGTDPNRLRVQAMDLLINALDSGTTLGAIEFGDVADAVFAPGHVGSNGAAVKSAREPRVQTETGGT